MGGFALFLINKKWSRIVLLCLVPVCALAAYFTATDRMNMFAACAGLAIIAASPVFEFLAGCIGERFFADTGTVSQTQEDDILDNKTKWRLIIAGYVIFILFAVFAIISIIRLNAKIGAISRAPSISRP